MSAANPSEQVTWLASTLRLTAFPSPSAQIGETNWWQELVGEAPASRTVQPRLATTKEEGVVEGKSLAITAANTRIDLVVSPVNGLESAESGFPSLGSLSENLSWFSGSAQRWFALATRPPLQRIAFGAVLEHPVGTRAEGYRFLSRFLPSLDLDPEGSSDLLYQINRPLSRTVCGLEVGINRLSRWMVAVFRIATISLGEQQLGRHLASESVAAHLELDVNTSMDFTGEFVDAQAPAVYDELTRLAVEISNRGDIP